MRLPLRTLRSVMESDGESANVPVVEGISAAPPPSMIVFFPLLLNVITGPMDDWVRNASKSS